MKKKKKGIFEGVRKTTAPPTRKFGGRRPLERVRPARPGKHKKPVDRDG